MESPELIFEGISGEECQWIDTMEKPGYSQLLPSGHLYMIFYKNTVDLSISYVSLPES